MTKRLAVAFVLLVWPNPLSAQLRPPNKAGMTMGHVHLNVRSIEAHRRFWVDQIGAKPVSFGRLEGVAVPGLIILLRQQEPTGPVSSEAINHMGLKVRKLSDLLAVFEKFGSKTEGVRIGAKILLKGTLLRPTISASSLWKTPACKHL
jgi:hypothetical protein